MGDVSTLADDAASEIQRIKQQEQDALAEALGLSTGRKVIGAGLTKDELADATRRGGSSGEGSQIDDDADKVCHSPHFSLPIWC